MRGHVLSRDAAKRAMPLQYPSEKHRTLDYRTLDAVFKLTKNPVYYSLPAQANQNVLKKAFSAWKGFFAALSDWKENPGKYRAKPRIPGYLKKAETTACFTNQTARMSMRMNGKRVLGFPGGMKVRCGAFEGTYIKTEIQPYHRGYRILVTYDDKAEVPKMPEHPDRIYGIDLGVDNFCAVAGNFGESPFLIRGGAVKSENRKFNKERARLMSELTAGKDSTRSVKDSKRLDRLSMHRDGWLRDFFYKCAHFICRRAVKAGVQAIVCGHNKGIKDGISLSKTADQNFVSIPETDFLRILTFVAARYGLPVAVREESYTSKASLLDLDAIPSYGQEGADTVQFSGKRVCRGLYRSGDGTYINADVNGAGNILRKEFPYAFDGVEDMSFLYKTTESVKYHDIYKVRRTTEKAPSGRKHRPGKMAVFNKRERMERRLDLKCAFPPSKKTAQASAGAA